MPLGEQYQPLHLTWIPLGRRNLSLGKGSLSSSLNFTQREVEIVTCIMQNSGGSPSPSGRLAAPGNAPSVGSPTPPSQRSSAAGRRPRTAGGSSSQHRHSVQTHERGQQRNLARTATSHASPSESQGAKRPSAGLGSAEGHYYGEEHFPAISRGSSTRSNTSSTRSNHDSTGLAPSPLQLQQSRPSSRYRRSEGQESATLDGPRLPSSRKDPATAIGMLEDRMQSLTSIMTQALTEMELIKNELNTLKRQV